MIEPHVFIATSLDGVIAREDGGIDCLDVSTAAEDHGYASFVDGMDGLIMGRATYETVLGFDIPWPYEKPVWVLSRSLTQTDVPSALTGRVRILADSPAEVLARAGDEGWARAYVDGGQLIRSFFAEGLIAEVPITRIPVLLGTGRPLFGPLPGDVALTHLETKSWPSGLVQSRYRVRH